MSLLANPSMQLIILCSRNSSSSLISCRSGDNPASLVTAANCREAMLDGTPPPQHSFSTFCSSHRGRCCLWSMPRELASRWLVKRRLRWVMEFAPPPPNQLHQVNTHVGQYRSVICPSLYCQRPFRRDVPWGGIWIFWGIMKIYRMSYNIAQKLLANCVGKESSTWLHN